MTGENDAIRVAVSTVIFSLRTAPDGDRLMLPLVRRTPRAVPSVCGPCPVGGWIRRRTWMPRHPAPSPRPPRLRPATSSRLYTFGDVDRAPARAITIVYWALLRSDLVDAQRAVADAPENVAWFDADALPELAYDRRIAEYALYRLRNKVGYSRIAAGLLPDEVLSRSCARCTRRCSVAGSTPRTSGGCWRHRTSSCPLTRSAPAAPPGPPVPLQRLTASVTEPSNWSPEPVRGRPSDALRLVAALLAQEPCATGP